MPGIEKVLARCCLAIACGTAVACAVLPRQIGSTHTGAWSACKTTAAAGSAILCDGAIFASIECKGPLDKACMAVVVRYANGEEATVFCASGYDIKRPNDYGVHDKPAFFYAARYPEIAGDGSLIWFKEGFFGGWRTYSMRDGELRAANSEEIWELRDLAFDRPPVHLWPGALPPAGTNPALR